MDAEKVKKVEEEKLEDVNGGADFIIQGSAKLGSAKLGSDLTSALTDKSDLAMGLTDGFLKADKSDSVI